MKFKQPEVHLIAEMCLNAVTTEEFLRSIGGVDWADNLHGPNSDNELLPELFGRLCYRSFAPGLNANVNKIREGNQEYLEHILDVNHGSVLEHSTVSFIFHNVSRVFTHELVRHRVGVAISQESLRYVRLDKLAAYLPECFKDDDIALEWYRRVYEICEDAQVALAKHFDLDNMKDFGRKKAITSAMRRLAPDGLLTTIGWTANIRTLRHVILMRTSLAAEEEIRVVFDQVAKICKDKYPNLFQDMERSESGEWTCSSH